MTFDYSGYDLRFIQKEGNNDESAHAFSYVYKFHSPVTKYNYILRADFHEEDVFAIKFYCKKDRHSKYKYSKIINKGDIGNILITCANIIPRLLIQHPNASFGFVGARTLDKASGKVESYINTQRFRVYTNIIKMKFGNVTFEHYEYPDISGYLLVNRTSCTDISAKETAIRKIFSATYNHLPDI